MAAPTSDGNSPARRPHACTHRGSTIAGSHPSRRTAPAAWSVLNSMGTADSTSRVPRAPCPPSQSGGADKPVGREDTSSPRTSGSFPDPPGDPTRQRPAGDPPRPRGSQAIPPPVVPRRTLTQCPRTRERRPPDRRSPTRASSLIRTGLSLRRGLPPRAAGPAGHKTPLTARNGPAVRRRIPTTDSTFRMPRT